MPNARVHSLQVLKDVKASVAEFADSVNQTLTSVDSDINRITQWLTQDRPAYWKAKVRRAEDEVAKAQTDIMRKRIIAAPEPASVVEEQKVLEKAKRRLELWHLSDDQIERVDRGLNARQPFLQMKAVCKDQ